MLKLLSGMISLFIYFCMGTVLVETGIGGYLWYNGTFTAQRNENAVKVLYGLEKTEIAGELIENSLAPPPRSYDEIRHHRSKITMDQDLRESSMRAGVDDLSYIDKAFDERKRRFTKLRQNFEQSYSQLQGAATNQSLVKMCETINALKPDQAVDQIIRMLDLSQSTQDPSLRNDMVTILKTLPAASQKKLLAEFKAEERAPYLAAMLNQIRLGMPDISVIRETREELLKYKDNQSERSVP